MAGMTRGAAQGLVGGILSRTKQQLGMEQRTPNQNKIVLLFIVGGVTVAEIAAIQELQAEMKAQGRQLLLGSTEINSTQRVVNYLLQS
jgi:hypothetical protein